MAGNGFNYNAGPLELMEQDNANFNDIFTNRVVLDNIFYHCTSPKELRLVCKLWNNVLLTGIPQLSLNFEQLLSTHNIKFTKELEKIDPNLCKSIIICEDICKPDLDMTIKVLQISFKLGAHIHYLHIQIDQGLCDTLYQILSNNIPNMRSLCINLIEDPKPEQNKKSMRGKMGMKSKLNEVTIATCPACGILSPKCTTLFDDIISAAPNLKRLTIIGDYVPKNMGGKIKLERFRFAEGGFEHEFPSEVEPPSELTWQKLAVLLKEISKSVQVLELHTTNMELVKITLPHMPNLRILRNCEVQSYNIYTQNWMELMPKLTSLTLVARSHPKGKNKSVLTVLRQLMASCMMKNIFAKNITSLTLGMLGFSAPGFQEVAILYQFKIVFPNLRKLDLNLAADQPQTVSCRMAYENGPGPLEPARNAVLLGEIFQAMATLNLEHVKVGIPFRYDFLTLVEAWIECAKSFFNNLKTLEIWNAKVMLTETCLGPEGLASFLEIFSLSKEMSSVILKNFSFGATVGNRIFKHILDNSLPIKFEHEPNSVTEQSFGLEAAYCPANKKLDPYLHQSRQYASVTWKGRRRIRIPGQANVEVNLDSDESEDEWTYVGQV